MKIDEIKTASRDPQQELELLVDRVWLPAAIQSWNFQERCGVTALFVVKVMYWGSLGDVIRRDPKYVDLTDGQCEVLLRIKDTSMAAELDRARTALKVAQQEIARLHKTVMEETARHETTMRVLRLKVSEAIK